MKTKISSRRDFIRKTTAMGTTALAFPQIVKAKTLGLGKSVSANNRINVALIGCGGRGTSGSIDYLKDPRVRFTALCDPNPARALRTQQRFAESGGLDYDIPAYKDFRLILQDDDFDAVHIATADHWHVPIALAAARAGKDIYCEKPLGLSIEQCLACQDITRKHGRVFQYGTQNRSIHYVRRATEMVLNGYIGDVRRAIVWAPPGIAGGFATPELPVPEGMDYEMWLGPAPVEPYTYDRCVREGQNNGIYHIYDYAIGFIAGWGAHPLDQWQWWADYNGLGVPARVEGTAVIPDYGLFNTITTWDYDCTYQNGFQMRFMDTTTYKGLNDPSIPATQGSHGTLYIGDKGWIACHRSGWEFSSEDLRRSAKDVMKIQLHDSNNHCSDFIDSIVSRNDPVSNLDAAIRSDIISHLCNISARVKRPVEWDSQRQSIKDDREAAAMMHRDMRAPWSLDIEI